MAGESNHREDASGHYNEFCLELGLLAQVLLTRKLDLTVIAEYWKELGTYDYPLVHRAIESARRRKWFPFPQPADLIEQIELFKRADRQRELGEVMEPVGLLPEISEGQRQDNLRELARLQAELAAWLTPGRQRGERT